MSPKSKPSKPVDIYVRVSQTGGRDVEAEGGTASDQETKCRKQLDADGLAVGLVFTDLDQSGGKTSRPAFDKALARIESGESGGIIVRNLRRFGRTTSGVVEGVRWIEDHGAAFISCEEKLDTSTPMGRFALTIFAALGALELEERTETWARARANMVERGIHAGPTVPLGYLATLNDHGKRIGFELDPETAPAVAEAFRMRARGESWRSIYGYLAELVPGRLSSLKAVAKLIRNRVYVGEARSGSNVHERAHEAIVSEGEFQAANRSAGPGERLSRVSKGTGEGALLAGQLKCAGCGGRMTYTYTMSGGHKYSFYRCQTNEGCPAKASIGAKVVEPHIEAAVLRLLSAPETERTSEPYGLDTAELDRSVERAKLDLEAWDDAFTGEHDPVAFKRGRAKRQAALVEAETARAEAAVAHAGSEEQDRFATLWQAGSPAAVEALWHALSIPDRRKIIANTLPTIHVSRGRGPVEERLSLAIV